MTGAVDAMTSRVHQRAHALAQLRQHLALEPRIGLEPRYVARARVWQRQLMRQVPAPGAHGVGQARLARAAEKMRLCILADQQREADVRQQRQQAGMPGASALRARGCITGAGLAGIAEAHRHDRHAPWVVERVGVEAKPFAQTTPAGVVPRNAARVHASARGLSDDEQTRGPRGAQHRAWSERQLRFAQPARANLPQQRVERAAHGSSLPGLRMPSGSNARFTARIRSSVGASSACTMKSRLARPMPCSPDSVPPSESASANTRAIAACARSACTASAGSNSTLTCRLPLPAWPKVTISNA